MIQFLLWVLVDRARCSVLGHEWHPSKVWAMMDKWDGYACDRCGKTQLTLYRWQEVSADDD